MTAVDRVSHGFDVVSEDRGAANPSAPDHAARRHSELGASAMSRWSKCPASVRLLRGHAGTSSLAAERGTACHEVAEAMLRKRLLLDRDNVLYGFTDDHPPSHYVGRTFNGIVIDEDLAEVAEDYVAVCLSVLEAGDRVWIERKFDLAELDPPAPMFGTADLVVYRPAMRRLIVIDLKSGSGVTVHASGNVQLRYYAVGALLSLPGLPIDDVEMMIVQPRVGDPVKMDRIDGVDLLDWTADLLAAARATQSPNAPLVAGEHCRWCGRKPVCRTYEARALEACRDEFDVIETGEVTLPLPEPAEMDPEELARRLELVPLVEDWAKTMRAYAYRRLGRGDGIPGWKLVPKRANRKWRDEEAARTWLLDQGLAEWDAVKQTVISPAQAEKLVGDKTGLADLVVAESSGPTLVRETDTRLAIVRIRAGEDFDIIDDPN